MASGKPLSVVKPGDTPPKPKTPAKPKTLTEAIERGTYLEILEAQRREIAVDVKGEKGPAKAAMHRQLSLLSKEIEELKAKALADGGAEDDDDDSAPETWDEATL